MHADIKGALSQINTSYKAFEHNGKKLTKIQVKKILEFALKKGYENTSQISDSEIEYVLGLNIKEGKYIFDLEKLKSDYELAKLMNSKTYTVRIFCYEQNVRGKFIAQPAVFKIIASIETETEWVVKLAQKIANDFNEGKAPRTKSTKI